MTKLIHDQNELIPKNNNSSKSCARALWVNVMLFMLLRVMYGCDEGGMGMQLTTHMVRDFKGAVFISSDMLCEL